MLSYSTVAATLAVVMVVLSGCGDIAKLTDCLTERLPTACVVVLPALPPVPKPTVPPAVTKALAVKQAAAIAAANEAAKAKTAAAAATAAAATAQTATASSTAPQKAAQTAAVTAAATAASNAAAAASAATVAATAAGAPPPAVVAATPPAVVKPGNAQAQAKAAATLSSTQATAAAVTAQAAAVAAQTAYASAAAAAGVTPVNAAAVAAQAAQAKAAAVAASKTRTAALVAGTPVAPLAPVAPVASAVPVKTQSKLPPRGTCTVQNVKPMCCELAKHLDACAVGQVCGQENFSVKLKCEVATMLSTSSNVSSTGVGGVAKLLETYCPVIHELRIGKKNCDLTPNTGSTTLKKTGLFSAGDFRAIAHRVSSSRNISVLGVAAFAVSMVVLVRRRYSATATHEPLEEIEPLNEPEMF